MIDSVWAWVRQCSKVSTLTIQLRQQVGKNNTVLGHGMRSIIFKVWIGASLLLACYFADHYLLLVWFYGFLRVHKEGLHFISQPSSKNVEDYVVSNGDHISKVDGFLSLPLTVAVWLVLILVGYLMICRRKGGYAA